MNVHIFGPMPLNVLAGPLVSQNISKDSNESDLLVFVDGGIQHAKSITKIREIASDHLLWIGDHDGLAPQVLSGWEESFEQLKHHSQSTIKINFPSNKDDSDLSLALQWLRDNPPSEGPYQRLYLYGFLGGRLDHQLAVLGEAHHLAKELPFESFEFYQANGERYIEIIKGSSKRHYHGMISVMSIEAQTCILEGALKYQGEHFFKELSSLGLSNEAKGPFQISCQKPIMLFYL